MESNDVFKWGNKKYIVILFVFFLFIFVGLVLFISSGKRAQEKSDYVFATGDVSTIELPNIKGEDVIWSSSDDSILKVDLFGNVEAVKPGKVTVTVVHGDEIEELVVNVVSPSEIVKSKVIELNKKDLSIDVGEEFTLTYRILPQNTSDKRIIWSSSDESIVSVENGIVKGLKAGSAIVSAKNGDVIEKCNVTVKSSKVKVEKIVLAKEDLTLSVGDTYYVGTSVLPVEASNNNFEWTSSNNDVAVVEDGLITAKWGGSSTVTVKDRESGISSKIKVVVKNYNLILDKNFLHTSGTKIVNKKNEEVVLRGYNLGVWLSRSFSLMQVQALAGSKSDFLKTGYSCINGVAFNQILQKNYGTVKARELVDVFYQNFITEDDLDLIAQSGANVVRVPFEYSLFLNERDANGNYTYKSADDLAIAWKYLDWIVKECGKRGIYVILDLHVVPGRQNQGGWCSSFTFFEDEKAQNAVAELWKLIAQRYKNNQVVAGYDLINEPQAKIAVLGPIYDKIYDAIRSVDNNHIIFMEENCVFCGFTEDDVNSKSDVIGALPSPSKYGWKNVVYSTHDYFYDTDSSQQGDIDASTSVSVLKRRADIKVKKIVNKRNQLQVPYYVGEFSQLGTTSSLSKYVEAWKYSMDLYDKYNISYTPWSYKSSWEPYFGTIYYGTKLSDLEKNNSFVSKGKFDFVNAKNFDMTKRIFSYKSGQAMRFNPVFYKMFLEQFSISSKGGRLADSVSIDCDNAVLKVGDTKTFNYSVNVDPKTIINGFKSYDVINKKVVWESSNKNIVTIDKNTGKINAKSKGTVVIRATLKPLVFSDESKNIVAECKIIVK